MSRVYAELARVTGARVIVDSSKRPSYAAFLRHVPGVDLYLVHMVRDPRASAYSWKHRKHKSVQGGREVTRRGAVDATARWVLLNWGAQRVMRRHGGSRSLTLRYEDFVARPRPCVKTVLSLVGEVPGHLPFAGDHTVRLSPNHTLSGNPSRYAAGTVHLRDNGEWKTAQSRLDAALATAVAAPYLRRYGYGVRV
jgi:hypothetical protein